MNTEGTMEKKRKIKRMAHFQQLPILIALIALVAVLSVLTPAFFTPYNMLNVLQQTSINAILAMGMTFVVITGGIDLSIGSIIAFTGIIMGELMKRNCPSGIIIVAGLVIGCCLGAVNGFLVSYLRMPPFIATLGTQSVAKGFALVIADAKNIAGFPEGFRFFGSAKIAGIIPVQIFIMLGVLAISFYVLRYRMLGRCLYAIGGNEEATRLSGIHVRHYKFMAYVISGLCAAVAGVILTAKLNAAQPTAGEGYEMDAVAAAVIGGASLSGGRGGAVGTMIGALIISVLNNGLTLLNINSYIQQIVIGVVIILAVLMDIMQQANKTSKQ